MDGNNGVVETFSEKIEKELTVNQALQMQQDRHQFEYAQSSLNASLADKREQRAHQKANFKLLLITITFIFGILIAFLSFCLFMNKDAIVIEIIKALLFATGGGGAGYAIGKRKES